MSPVTVTCFMCHHVLSALLLSYKTDRPLEDKGSCTPLTWHDPVTSRDVLELLSSLISDHNLNVMYDVCRNSNNVTLQWDSSQSPYFSVRKYTKSILLYIFDIYLTSCMVSLNWDTNGRLYAQLDQPRKFRFEVNAVKVSVYCKFKKANEENIELNHDIHNLKSSNILTSSSISGFEPRCLKYIVVQLCINQNDHLDLCTTGPTHISCKFNKKNRIISTLQTLCVVCRSTPKFP